MCRSAPIQGSEACKAGTHDMQIRLICVRAVVTDKSKLGLLYQVAEKYTGNCTEFPHPRTLVYFWICNGVNVDMNTQEGPQAPPSPADPIGLGLVLPAAVKLPKVLAI